MFTAQGRNGRKGLRTFSVSGHVRDPGVKIAHAGITARELIDELSHRPPQAFRSADLHDQSPKE